MCNKKAKTFIVKSFIPAQVISHRIMDFTPEAAKAYVEEELKRNHPHEDARVVAVIEADELSDICTKNH